jgi:hypothetical protein
MPRGDRTGPRGMGPMTGRGAGFCGGSGAPGFLSRGFFQGFFGGGRGRGGRGWRNMFYATGLPGWARAGMDAAGAVPGMTRQQELDVLKQQAVEAGQVLENLRKRISELEGSPQTQ